MVDVRLAPVDADNWRACVALRVAQHQRRWVADVAYYLCLCTYGGVWHPLAIDVDGEIVGFMMWGVDEDASRWIGGLIVDQAHQRRGIARAALTEAIGMLTAQEGCRNIALSCSEDNRVALDLYTSLGFELTGETAEDGAEVVSRLAVPS